MSMDIGFKAGRCERSLADQSRQVDAPASVQQRRSMVVIPAGRKVHLRDLGKSTGGGPFMGSAAPVVGPRLRAR